MCIRPAHERKLLQIHSRKYNSRTGNKNTKLCHSGILGKTGPVESKRVDIFQKCFVIFIYKCIAENTIIC